MHARASLEERTHECLLANGLFCRLVISSGWPSSQGLPTSRRACAAISPWVSGMKGRVLESFF